MSGRTGAKSHRGQRRGAYIAWALVVALVVTIVGATARVHRPVAVLEQTGTTARGRPGTMPAPRTKPKHLPEARLRNGQSLAAASGAPGAPQPKPPTRGFAACLADFRAKRRNLFFRSRRYVADALGQRPRLVAEVAEFLMDPRELRRVARTRPLDEEAVRGRMSAIDLLETVGKEAETRADRRAVEYALADLISRSRPEGDAVAAGLQEADQADALAALTRLDPQLGVSTLRRIPPSHHRAMRVAVGGALMDIGYRRADALHLVGPAPSR